MEPYQVIELKHVIVQKLLDEILEQAAKIDTKRYTRIRFALEFNIDPVRQVISDSGVEVRYRRPLQ